MYHDVVMAGFGGQGILLIGNLLAEAALDQGLHVTFLPAYGVEMRGGTANCTVVYSDQPIGSPAVGAPHVAILMSSQARAKFEKRVKPGGILILNTSLVAESEVERNDIELIAVPLNQVALSVDSARLANMVALGIYLEKTRVIDLEHITAGFEELLSERNKRFIPKNIEAIKKGMEIAG
jgi:2-oxoglutarate ferredoxin oxidoreductase subunit gamma